MKTICAFFFTLALVLTAGERQPLEKTGKRLNSQEATNLLAHAKREGATLQVGQAPAVMEAVGNPGGVYIVSFQTVKNLEVGVTAFAFGITMPDGTEVALGAFQLSFYGESIESGASTQLWNGSFPWMWPSGPTRFTAVMVSPSGKITATSATIIVFGCCGLAGPLERAEVSLDGSYVKIEGNFDKDTVATLSGGAIPINFGPVPSPTPTNGPTLARGVGTILFQNYSPGPQILTVCSKGECSTRIIYVTPSPRG